MRIIYFEPKSLEVTEPETRFPTLIDAVAALDSIISRGFSIFGQVLADDGLILANRAKSTFATIDPEKRSV